MKEKIIIKHYKPGKRVNLYDFKKQKSPKGILLINNLSPIPMQNFFLHGLGLGLLFVAIFFITNIILPISSAYLSLVTFSQKKTANQLIATGDFTYANNFILEDNQPLKDKEFNILIPKIDVQSEIIPNVDASNEDSYAEELKKGVAHAASSYFPGEKGPVVLFSHSTDSLLNVEQYNAKFYALKNLEIGDQIKINFRSKRFNYKVSKKIIINPNELDNIRKTDAALILSTCWPPGTSWQRLIIFADISDDKII